MQPGLPHQPAYPASSDPDAVDQLQNPFHATVAERSAELEVDAPDQSRQPLVLALPKRLPVLAARQMELAPRDSQRRAHQRDRKASRQLLDDSIPVRCRDAK